MLPTWLFCLQALLPSTIARPGPTCSVLNRRTPWTPILQHWPLFMKNLLLKKQQWPVPERLSRIGTTLASDRAMGGIAPTVTSSPGPSGITSMAVLSLPACVVKSSPPSTVTTSFPTLVTMGGIAPADACPEREANILEALRARPGIAPSVQIPSSRQLLA